MSLPSADGVERRPFGIELLALLVVVGDLHVRPAPDLARVRARARRSAAAAASSCRSRSARSSPIAIAAHDRASRGRARSVRRRTPCVTPSASKTIWPDRSARLGLQPDGARSVRGAPRAPRRIAISARTRPSLRVRRALMPWRSHASSSASRLSNFSCCDRFVRQPLLLLRRNVA